ncbi:MAG: phage GP46 family protein [Betaproteobacteria bacterium]|nr:phage GP46 family protein [Betaproteobacteria bacterium]
MLKLIQTAPCEFDLAPDDPADANTAAATLVYAALFTDAEAPLRRVGEQWDRRGWYKDPQAGSGLWHVRRQPLTAAARLETIAIIERVLARATPALQGIAVREVIPTDPAGNISRLLIEITGLHNGRKFLVRVPLSDA